jgi:elongation factor P
MTSWHFMNTVTFDQIEINSSQMGNAKKFLVGQEVCEIILWDGQPYFC